jgi:hypothetical protein
MNFEITYETVDDAFCFLDKAVRHFRKLNISNKQIKILMPEWFKIAMLSQLPTLVNGLMEYQLEQFKMYGIETHAHYKNEIVVYFPYFHYHPENYAAQIFEIPIVEIRSEKIEKPNKFE